MQNAFVLLFLALLGVLSLASSTSEEVVEIIKVLQPEISVACRRQRKHLSRSVFYDSDEKITILKLGEFILDLRDGGLQFHPSFNVKWDAKDAGNAPDCEFKVGNVRGSNEKAAVSLCGNEVIGFFHTPFGPHFIKPANESSRYHVIYKVINNETANLKRFKRSEPTSDQKSDGKWVYFNLTGDTMDIDSPFQENAAETTDNDGSDTERDENPLPKWHRENQDGNDDLGYFVDSAWEPSALTSRKKPESNDIPPPERWLELAVAVDSTVIAFHGKHRIEKYILSLMNIVSAIFQDPSLDANINLAITRLLFYENRKLTVIKQGNAKKSLENVNNWNRKLHASLGPGEVPHDMAVWITRSDIGGPAGYAPVSGACDPKRSCGLIRDEGLTSAFIIAHELAHVLGLSHDGDQKAFNNCHEEANQGSVMAPLVSATFHKFSWSECSRVEFRRNALKWNCLVNRPRGNQTIKLNATLETTFSMDEQCRMEFGNGYTLCTAFDISDPCSHLWCSHVSSSLVCKTKKGPPLEGTECGFGKWCVGGYCEDVVTTHSVLNPVVHNSQDGGWGRWSPWGPCSRTCGIGVEFRSRKCDSPPPFFGGKDCEGTPEEWRICKLKPCPEPQSDFRAQQCKRLPQILSALNISAANTHWLPYDSAIETAKCKLVCMNKSSKEIFDTGENLVDGTPCSYETTDICVQGVCQHVGCDGELFSQKKEDTCGVCGGDNSTCSSVKSSFRKRIRRDVFRLMVVPRLARSIRIFTNITTQITRDPKLVFMLKDRKKHSYPFAKSNMGRQSAIFEGTKFRYKRQASMHEIFANGPLLSEMILMVQATKSEMERGLNVSVLSEYYVSNALLNNATRFAWNVGGWSTCSASCGGGRRVKTISCKDLQDNKIVPRRRCALIAKPQVEAERCNTFSCTFYWLAGPWEPCSATCGSSGIQHRELYCVPQSIVNGGNFQRNSTDMEQIFRFMVNPSKCTGNPPHTSKPCNRGPCLSHWTYEWSQCSATCGKGISMKMFSCPPPAGESYFSCGTNPPPQRKSCQGPYNRFNNEACRKRKKKPCLADQSKFCSLQSLEKYCSLAAFRRICCKTCSNVILSPTT